MAQTQRPPLSERVAKELLALLRKQVREGNVEGAIDVATAIRDIGLLQDGEPDTLWDDQTEQMPSASPVPVGTDPSIPLPFPADDTEALIADEYPHRPSPIKVPDPSFRRTNAGQNFDGFEPTGDPDTVIQGALDEVT